MSKNKSLGSSPIAFNAGKSAMEFIPDRGIAKQREEKASTISSTTLPSQKDQTPNPKSKSNNNKNKKKVVSYNLEVDLVRQVKTIANNKGMYYSSLVSSALKEWISNHVQIPLHKDSRN